jgi:hypothetical protein
MAVSTALLTALFQVSGIMAHVTYMFIRYSNGHLFYLLCSSFQQLGRGKRESKVIS